MFKAIITATCPECDYDSSKGEKALEATLIIKKDDPEVEQVLSEDRIHNYLILAHHQASPDCEGELQFTKKFVPS